MGQALRIKNWRAHQQRLKGRGGREKRTDDVFMYERVCRSKRMLKKVGALSKDLTVYTCVTACGSC
ncbi:hypothetical protein Ddye_023118 [Dipteronia dyeriana]|uniref:Uncharacterized protein n=1 Tax=Dipteronia dyeriana TaxID=168575 RepID=A0AAD9WT32_9ROSI|nr:hypothetical protein Ddye_023118 [Dipteronia dyeriana]